jgi:hypothetical protein
MSGQRIFIKPRPNDPEKSIGVIKISLEHGATPISFFDKNRVKITLPGHIQADGQTRGVVELDCSANDVPIR